mmetsp:Transcript_25012/g.69796  ORF Transcript_25012/g.69796 Transcript_25012/m.69796 type:complete len:211 (-) Transcript_25012:377-1009(-)
MHDQSLQDGPSLGRQGATQQAVCTLSPTQSGLMRISGAIQGNVPVWGLTPLTYVCRRCFDSPKSATLHVGRLSLQAISKLPLLRSKCTMCLECRYSRPLAASRATTTLTQPCLREGSCRDSATLREPDAMNSPMIAGVRNRVSTSSPGCSRTMPYTHTTLGWRRLKSMPASSIRSITWLGSIMPPSPSGDRSDGLRHLTATSVASRHLPR